MSRFISSPQTYFLHKANYPRLLAGFLFVLLLGSYAKIFAISAPYSPGTTLDPACAPGEVNCTVNPFSVPGNAISFTTISAPTAPVVALAGVAGNVDIGDHYYKVTFVNHLGETTGGVSSSLITVLDNSTNGQVNITSIPTSSNGTVTARKIYRTKAGQGTYFLLTTIADNTTTTYVDTIADASLSTTTLPVNNTTTGAFYKDNSSFLHFYGNGNIFLGEGAGNLTLTGERNVAIGSNALKSVTSGSSFTVVGYNAGQALTSGGGTGTSENGTTIIGAQAAIRATGNLRSTIVGAYAAPDVTGTLNTIFGRDAGEFLTTGSQNILLGDQAGSNSVPVTTESNNIVIGYRIGLPQSTVGNQMTIGNLIYAQGGFGTGVTVGLGFVGIGNPTPIYRLDVAQDAVSYAARIFNDGNATTRTGLLIQAGVDDHTLVSTSTLIGFQDGDGTGVGSISFGSSSTAYNTTSDERLKENIVDTNLSIDNLMTIKIRDFTWKADKDHKVTHGFLAQELYRVYPQAVTVPENPNDNWMVDYSKLMPLAVKSIQDLEIKIQGIMSLNPSKPSSTAYLVKQFLQDSGNTITDLFVKTVHTETLCVKGTCVNEEQLQKLLELVQIQNVSIPVKPDLDSVVSDDIDNDTNQTTSVLEAGYPVNEIGTVPENTTAEDEVVTVQENSITPLIEEVQ